MRLNNKYKNTATILIGLLGFLSSLITILTTSFKGISIYIGISIIVLIIMIVFIVLYVIPKDNLPDGMDDIAEEMENPSLKRNIKIIFPCDSNYYQGANKLAKEKFGKNSVSTKIVNDWKKRNDFLLTCLTDKNKLVGYFDILPLKTDFANSLIKGDVGEKDIKAEHILGIHEMKDAEYIYFAGIAVKDTGSGIGCIHGTYLIWAAILYIEIFYKNSNLKKILTIPTSDSGRKIVEHLKFSLEREGNHRKDGFDIYSHEFQPNKLIKTINEKNDLYKRFDLSAYSNAFQKITGKKPDLPINIT